MNKLIYIFVGIVFGLIIGLSFGIYYSQSKFEYGLFQGSINGKIELTKWLIKYFPKEKGVNNVKIIDFMPVKDASINVIEINGVKSLEIEW